MAYRDPGIQLLQPFDPKKIIHLRHELHRHPLLQLPKLVELAKRLAGNGSVRSHSDRATEGTNFNEAPKLNPAAMSIAESVEQLESAHCWMSLLNVQVDPEY